MAISKQTYECYVCRNNGFDNVRVYLDGKTETGKPIYKNIDLTQHQHYQRKQSHYKQEEEGDNININKFDSQLKSINATLAALASKVDRVINLVYAQSQKQPVTGEVN